MQMSHFACLLTVTPTMIRGLADEDGMLGIVYRPVLKSYVGGTARQRIRL
jgi:hypothetical protein